MSLKVEWLGVVPYATALGLQAEAVAARCAGSTGDRLLLLEHPPVVTVGRSFRPENLLESREVLASRGVEVHEVARGGDVTFHAPGQLVGYPIVHLGARGRDVHRFLRDCEGALIGALAELGLATCRIAGMTGVFMSLAERVGDSGRPLPARKIASIGVGVRRWVTCHGFALNVSLDLAGFDVIVPCGLSGVEMTSVALELERAGTPVGDRAACAARVMAAVRGSFERTFA